MPVRAESRLDNRLSAYLHLFRQLRRVEKSICSYNVVIIVGESPSLPQSTNERLLWTEKAQENILREELSMHRLWDQHS